MGDETIAEGGPEARDHTRLISAVILQEEQRIRKRFSWLAWQDTLCCAWFFGSLLIVALSTTLYLRSILPWLVATCVNGVAISILHELEHDLIHNLYFKTKPYVQHFMFLVIWMGKLHANPWNRKTLHLLHHKASGQVKDVEERILGLGLPFGLKRLAMAVHPFANILQFDTVWRESGMPMALFYKQIFQNGPTIVIFAVLIHLFFLHLVNFYVYPLKFLFLLGPILTWPFVRDTMVVWLLPNLIRNMSLIFMTTSCHYYGDIPKGYVYFQNQIINHPLLWPFQIFCFNFASTHIIHHYVPSQPFYLRQMIAHPVHAEMIRQGVRNNDFGVVFRSNGFKRKQEDSTKELMVFVAFALLCMVGGLVVVPVLNFTLLSSLGVFLVTHAHIKPSAKHSD